MEIKFIAVDEHTRTVYQQPLPSYTSIPNWYKNMPVYMEGENSPGISKFDSSVSSMTLKGCSPFLDAMTAGYTWSLPADIQISKQDDGDLSFKWRVDDELITEHSPIQHPGLPLKENNFVLKWNFRYVISTPPGYSVFFTHPINRFDLPFTTLSGIVDTDTYELPVQFPFIWNKRDDFYILEKGTPLCQFFPIKRDKWQSKKIDIDDIDYWRNLYKFFNKIQKPYKSKHWNKKIYR